MNAPFAHIFKNYQPEADLRELVEALGVERLDGDRAQRTITAHCAAEHFLDADLLRRLEDGIAACYGLASFSIQVHYPTRLLSEEYLQILCEQLRVKHPLVNGFFRDAAFDLQQNQLSVSLLHGGADAKRISEAAASAAGKARLS